MNHYTRDHPSQLTSLNACFLGKMQFSERMISILLTTTSHFIPTLSTPCPLLFCSSTTRGHPIQDQLEPVYSTSTGIVYSTDPPFPNFPIFSQFDAIKSTFSSPLFFNPIVENLCHPIPQYTCLLELPFPSFSLQPFAKLSSHFPSCLLLAQ